MKDSEAKGQALETLKRRTRQRPRDGLSCAGVTKPKWPFSGHFHCLAGGGGRREWRLLRGGEKRKSAGPGKGWEPESNGVLTPNDSLSLRFLFKKKTVKVVQCDLLFLSALACNVFFLNLLFWNIYRLTKSCRNHTHHPDPRSGNILHDPRTAQPSRKPGFWHRQSAVNLTTDLTWISAAFAHTHFFKMWVCCQKNASASNYEHSWNK